MVPTEQGKLKFTLSQAFVKLVSIWKLRIWSNLLKKSVMENFIFCAVETGEQVWNFQKFLIYWTTCNHKQTQQRLKYLKSRDLIRYRRVLIFEKHKCLSKWSFIMYTLLLTYVSYFILKTLSKHI